MGQLEREHWGLVPVAQLDSYKGLLFATFDPTAPPLLEYLGEMAWYLDTFFDRREGGIEVIGGMHKWVMPCNWKFPAENFGGDGYHVSNGASLSAIKTGFSSGVSIKPTSAGQPAVSRQRSLPDYALAHRTSLSHRYPRSWPTKRRSARRSRSASGLGYDLVNPIVGTVFPNFSFLRATSRTFRVWHPRGLIRLEVWSWVYVDKAAPPEVKEALRLAGIRGFSPSGTFEQDDMDNWQECTRTCRGVVSRRLCLEHPDGAGP